MRINLFSNRLSSRKSITVFLIAIIVLAVAGISIQYVKSKFFDGNISPASVKELVDNNLNEEFLGPIESLPQLPDIEANIAPLPSSETLESVEIEKQDSEIDLKIVDLLEKIQHNQQQNNEALLYFDERLKALESLEPTIQLAVDSYKESTKSLSQILGYLETKLNKAPPPAEIQPEVTIESHQSQPPFRLIAIDRWENQWNAILEFEGRMTMIEPLSSRAGWQLLKINPAKQSALFQAKSGRKLELRVQS